MRTTVVAVATVGVALAVGSVAMVVLLRGALTREVRRTTRLRATQVARALESGAGAGSLAVAEQDEQLLQVLDAHGNVTGSSPNLAGRPAVVRLEAGRTTVMKAPINDHDDFVVAAATANTSGGRSTVIVAQALADVTAATQAITRLLLIGLPILVALVALTIWRVVHRALAPVEAIRAEVDSISATELGRRVPIPPGDDEIARLAATMNQMLGRLEGADAAQRRFISDASHELRSPVASIRQHAEVALAHPEHVTTVALAETVLAEDLRVGRLVEDLLVLAKVDEQALRLQRIPLDLDDLVFEEARHLRQTTTLRVDTAGVAAARVSGDAAALRRVLRNLGDNAQRHGRGRILFTLAETGNAVVLTVDDDGPGIAEPDRARVFGRFVRLDVARARDDGGSGLGLAIVAELVRAHGGSVLVGESALGGLRVELTLPGPQGRESGP